jgi:hypothetical protein
MMKNLMLVIMLVVCVAMTATTFGSTDYDGVTNISTNIDPNVIEPRIGAGAAATFNILDGGTFNCQDEMRMGENYDATINVEVGGHLNADVEVAEPRGNYATEWNIYGTAFVGQFKIYGAGKKKSTEPYPSTIIVPYPPTTILVDGTLTVKEGLLGKWGAVEMTITTNGTFIVEGNGEDAEVFSIDSAIYSDFSEGLNDHGGYDSFLNIVGNGRMLIKSGNSLRTDPEDHGNAIKGNGILGYYVVTAGTVGDEIGYDVYTACSYGEEDAQQRGDWNYDCKVNLADLAIMASGWLNGVVDLDNLAVMASYWLVDGSTL